MSRKPKRIMVEHVIVNNFNIDGLVIENLYDDMEVEFGGLTNYENVRLTLNSVSDYAEDGFHIEVVGDRLENDVEYEKRIAAIARTKERELAKKQTKLEKIKSQMAKLEKEKNKLEKKTPSKAVVSKTRIESIS